MNLDVLLCLAVYLVPCIVAYYRQHGDTASIAVVNILLGWTFIGWVGCLAWAVHGKHV